MDYNEINKQNLPKWEHALKYISNILKENDIKYYLSASGLEYILGSKTYPYDIRCRESFRIIKTTFHIRNT